MISFKFNGKYNKAFITDIIKERFPNVTPIYRRYGSVLGTYRVYLPEIEGMYELCQGLGSSISYVKTIPKDSFWCIPTNNIYKDVIIEKNCFTFKKTKDANKDKKSQDKG